MHWFRGGVTAWRSGTRRSQRSVLAVLVAGVAVSCVVSAVRYELFPVAGYFLWLLAGAVLLRFSQLVVLVGLIALAGVAAVASPTAGDEAPLGPLVMLGLTSVLVLYVSSRQRSGLPGPLSEALLADLRDRLDAQGRVPSLPQGWHAQSAMVAAFGVGYAGDFMVTNLDEEEQRLELVLVDVVGKGVAAAPSALLFAGALGGLVGALRGPALFEAANDFLLRQGSEETFATAVHLSVGLVDGRYTILSAGHPPALRWSPEVSRWEVDNSRGTALGVLPHPELNASHGVLGAGEALMFYTDGVVETRGADIDERIAWLQETARRAVRRGFAGAARRVVDQVPRGDDDRALLILSRD